MRATAGPLGARETHELSVVGRLRPGISVETAAATIATVGRRLEQAFPSVNAGYSTQVENVQYGWDSWPVLFAVTKAAE